MDYTDFYCYECLYWNYDAFGKGNCYHEDMNGWHDKCSVNKYCRACWRFKKKLDNV